MATQRERTERQQELDAIDLTDEEHWVEGPPSELFRDLRNECPLHWSEINEYPDEAGFWSLTRADDVREVSLDWETYSSERGGVMGLTHVIPLELQTAQFIAMDPPKHDRLKTLFQRGFTPKRIAEHEDAIREIAARVLDGVADRGECDLVSDVAQPVVSRVIGMFMGIPEEDDAAWAALMNSTLGLGDDDLNPGGADAIMSRDIPEIFERGRAMIAERRENPTDDLTTVLMDAEIDGERLEEHEIVMGFFLLVAAGNDSTKATYTSGMRALLEHPDQMRMLVEDPSLIPGAVEECLRMYPAFAHFRRTGHPGNRARRLPRRRGRQGDHVVRLEQPGRSQIRGPGPLRRPPQSRPPGLRGRRPPLLPRGRTRPPRAEGSLRGDPEALPRHEARRRADTRRLGLPQPAEGAARALLGLPG